MNTQQENNVVMLNLTLVLSAVVPTLRLDYVYL